MKKTYTTPEVITVNVLLVDAIAVSVTINGESSGIVSEEEEGDGDDQAVSFFNVWDTSEEE